MELARRLFAVVHDKRPDLYKSILYHIQPHRLESILPLFEAHLQRINLDLFNQHYDAIPEFCWTFVKRMRLPQPGDPYGIWLTCRITKSDTQGALDSKHLQSSMGQETSMGFNVEKALHYELELFGKQLQVFELATRRTYATLYVERYTIPELLKRIPDACHLERGGPLNKGRDRKGAYGYLNTFRYILVKDRGCIIKILYVASKDLSVLLRFLEMDKMVALSDIRYVFQKCGIVSYFFNLMQLCEKQLFPGDDNSVYKKDVVTVIKYQCRSGKPLPLTRDGLAKNTDRSPIEVLSFEAPKKNFVRLSTGANRDQRYKVETSADKIFFGQQFSEGTGYKFALMSAEAN